MKDFRPRIHHLLGVPSKHRNGTCAVLGSFDGVHRGHQLLLKRAKQVADQQGLPLTVVTFSPHPLSVVRGNVTIEPLATLRQKVHALRLFGADHVACLHFTQELAALSAEHFVDSCLLRGLEVQYLVVGEDAAVGRGKEAGPAEIISLMQRKGGGGEVVCFLTEQDHRKIGSRYIREAVRGARLREAWDLLGRPFSLCGRVVRGAGRGKKMGVPTLNLWCRDQLLPPYGVYSSAIAASGTLFWGVVNVGVRPTFDGTSVSVEGHLLDATVNREESGRAEFFLLERIREERRFSSADDLVNQIKADCEQARTILGGTDLSLLEPWACLQ